MPRTGACTTPADRVEQVMVDRSLVWTGELNNPFVLGGAVGLYDTTLRDGEQTVGVVLTPEAKLEIAHALSEMGVQRIEAGFPRVTDEDRRAMELVAGAGLDAEVWGFARAVPADVEAVVELGLSNTVIECPISDGKLRALGIARETMLSRIRTAVAFAADRGVRVAYFGVDGTRADLAFLERAYRVALDAGAQELVVVDTLGIATPEAVERLVATVRGFAGDEVPVHFHGHNDFGLATACAIAAVRAGATWLHGTVNGMGERAGNVNLIEVALTLEAAYGVSTGIDLGRAVPVSRRVRELSGYELEPWKAAVGENLFRRETGAVASQFHDPPAVEPFSSQLVGATRSIVLGKKSGIDSIRIKSRELGFEVEGDAERALLDAVKRRGAEKRALVSDEEFAELARAVV
jgi:isopropylmalate/homocitrate/citramalate synthase